MNLISLSSSLENSSNTVGVRPNIVCVLRNGRICLQKYIQVFQFYFNDRLDYLFLSNLAIIRRK